MFKKLALLLSVLAISKFAFANTGSEGSAAGKAHEEGHAKAHEEHGKSHDKGHEYHGDSHGKKGSASK
jgi:hypothetical protein